MNAALGTPSKKHDRLGQVLGRIDGLTVDRHRDTPLNRTLSPVAVTMMSASTCSPEFIRTPVGVNSAIVSVTTEAYPCAGRENRSPSGTTHMRSSHGL